MSLNKAIVRSEGPLETARAYVNVRDPLNSFVIEGVIGIPPKRYEDVPGLVKALFVVSHRPNVLDKAGERVRPMSGKIVCPQLKAYRELAERVLALEVGTYVIVRGRFESGWKSKPMALEVEVIDDPSSRMKFDEDTALAIALGDRARPPAEKKKRAPRKRRA